jgi:uncharacterized protein
MPPVLLRRQTVISSLQARREEILRLGVRQLSLFGSVSRDEASEGSDVDLLVEFEPGQKSFDNFMNLYDLLESLVDAHVELLTTDALSQYLGPTILGESRVIVRRQ